MLLAEDWRKVNHAGHESLSQAFGCAAHDLGAEALLVPSARVPGGLNLVYFPESLAARRKVDQKYLRSKTTAAFRRETTRLFVGREMDEPIP